MLRQILIGLFRSELKNLKRRSAGGLMILAGIMLMGLASIVALVALHLWLTTFLPGWQAALVISGILIFFALLLVLAGRSMARRHQAKRDELDALAQALMGKQNGKSSDGTPTSMLAVAIMAGFVIGRRLTK